MRYLFLILFLPLAVAGEFEDFLSAKPAIPIPAVCDQAYRLYVYGVGDVVDYAVVERDGGPVFSFDDYVAVLRAYLYKAYLDRSKEDIRILTPSAVSAFSKLLAKLEDEKYELSLAKTYMHRCFPKFSPQIDTMDAVRESVVARLRSFISTLRSESDALLGYLKSKEVNCDFDVNSGIYDELESISGLLNTYESYSKQLRTSIAVGETNCAPNTVLTISNLLEPPFDSSQQELSLDSLAFEREIFSFVPDEEEIRILLQKSMKFYQKTLYEEDFKKSVEAPFGSQSLQEAVQYVLSTNISWKRQDLLETLRKDYDSTLRLASEGKYEEARGGVRKLRKLVERIFEAGVEERRGFEIPPWIYGVVIMVAGIIILKMMGRRGDDEVDDYYGNDYA